VLFDRSWYNRAGVERVMGFCTEEEVEEFFRSVPEFELRFLGRIYDPMKQWKFSPMDLESRRRWEAYTKAKEAMLEHTHITEAPWWVVQAVDKKRARLNCIHHLLSQFPYTEVEHQVIELPQRERHPDYTRQPVPPAMFIPEIY
jgi:polyphosphate kinase 2 (PPK2 family)